MSKLSVVILTYNEEPNLEQALKSVHGWADRILILDSHSTDRTLEIAERYGCHVQQRKFTNYAEQRNAAIRELPIDTEWMLFLDADEWLPEDLKAEISEVVARHPEENGFYLNRRFIWMGRWIKRGYYPTWILRLFRHGKGYCEARTVNEHLVVEGKVGHLKHDFIHEDRKDVADWIEKHNRYAEKEARELLVVKPTEHIEARLFGTQAERKRWLRQKVWNHMPPLIRPFFYFTYRFFVQGGILDGREAFIFHFLQALWFPLLIDIKYLELQRQQGS